MVFKVPGLEVLVCDRERDVEEPVGLPMLMTSLLRHESGGLQATRGFGFFWGGFCLFSRFSVLQQRCTPGLTLPAKNDLILCNKIVLLFSTFPVS